MGHGVRLYNWQSRLTDAIREAQRARFDPKHWNCALFARSCVEAITGRSMPRKLRGSLEATVDGLFPRISPRMACRGDVVLGYVPQPSLGICCGRMAAFVTASGLTYFPMRKARIAWSV